MTSAHTVIKCYLATRTLPKMRFDCIVYDQDRHSSHTVPTDIEFHQISAGILTCCPIFSSPEAAYAAGYFGLVEIEWDPERGVIDKFCDMAPKRSKGGLIRGETDP